MTLRHLVVLFAFASPLTQACQFTPAGPEYDARITLVKLDRDNQYRVEVEHIKIHQPPLVQLEWEALSGEYGFIGFLDSYKTQEVEMTIKDGISYGEISMPQNAMKAKLSAYWPSPLCGARGIFSIPYATLRNNTNHN